MSMSVQALKQTNVTKEQRVQTLRARTFAAALKVIAVMAETVQVKWGTGAIKPGTARQNLQWGGEAGLRGSNVEIKTLVP